MIRRSSSAERRWSFDQSGSERRAEKAKDRGQVFVERASLGFDSLLALYR